MISRLLKSKGVGEYLEAARTVKQKHPEVRFCLLGKYETQMQDALSKEYVQKFIDDGIIERFEETNDVRPYYAQCSVYVLPSYREGTPRTVLEAMATGRPILTTDTQGCRETVRDGVNGFLVDENAASMAVLLARIIDRKELMRSAGERAASDLYISWADAIKAAYERYPEVIENYKAGKYKKSLRPSDGLFKLSAEMMDSVNRFYERQNNIRRLLDPDEIRDRLNQLDANATQLLNRFELGDLDYLGRSKPKENPGSPKTSQEIQDKYL